MATLRGTGLLRPFRTSLSSDQVLNCARCDNLGRVFCIGDIGILGGARGEVNMRGDHAAAARAWSSAIWMAVEVWRDWHGRVQCALASSIGRVTRIGAGWPTRT